MGAIELNDLEVLVKTLPFWPVAWRLATSAAVTFAFDMLLEVAFPGWRAMQKIYEDLMPGFKFLSWGTFFLGLLEAFVGGIWVAVLFVPIYNYFSRREANKRVVAPELSEQHH